MTAPFPTAALSRHATGANLPSRSDIEGWTEAISYLSTSAAAYGAAAENIETAADTHVQQLTAPGGTNWHGDAADDAEESAYADRGVVYRAADFMREMQKIANRGAGNISLARDKALDAIAEAETDHFHVDEDLSVTDRREYTGDEVALFEERQIRAEEHRGYIEMRAQALASQDAEVGEELKRGAATLESMPPHTWKGGSSHAGSSALNSDLNDSKPQFFLTDFSTNTSIDPLQPLAQGETVWAAPPPPGKVSGTGTWTIDHSRGQSDPRPPESSESGTGQVTPYEPHPARQEPWTGPMSYGQPGHANGLDLEHNYRIRISGTQQTDIVTMVQVGEKWYPATWQDYTYEIQDQNRLVGIGDHGSLSEFPRPGPWRPSSLAEIGLLSTKFPNNTFYIPDGCGGSLEMVDAAFPKLPPPIPIMINGG